MADSTNQTPAVQAPAASSSTMTWRKISLPLPHLFPHLTINLRGHMPPARSVSPPSIGGSAPAAKVKSGRDWKLRRQKTYDSPGCLNTAIAVAAPTAGKPPPHRQPGVSVANDATASAPVTKVKNHPNERKRYRKHCRGRNAINEKKGAEDSERDKSSYYYLTGSPRISFSCFILLPLSVRDDNKNSLKAELLFTRLQAFFFFSFFFSPFFTDDTERICRR